MVRALPAFLFLAGLMAACGTPETPSTAPAPATDTVAAAPPDTTPTEVAPILISEHKVGEVHMNRAHHEAVRAKKPTDGIDHTKPYETASHEDIKAALGVQEMSPREPQHIQAPLYHPIVVSGTVEETDHAMLVSYEKKGVEVLEVYTDPADPEHVEHVVFTHKNHVDEYNVRPGMKGHEARKLRKELKHMQHKGQVFLYEEDSNIVYRLKALDTDTGTLTQVQIDEMEIEAIVWRNQHHTKHEKKKKA